MNQNYTHRLDLLSACEPIKSLRLGHPGTGYSFYLTRCRNKKAFVQHVRERHLDNSQSSRDVPVAKCYPRCEMVLPGTFDEAAGDMLCEIHLVVIEQDSRLEETRHWYHEIGHAADFAKQAFPVLCSRKLIAAGLPYESALVTAAQVEIPAYVTELLSEAITQALQGPVTSVSSGLPLAYEEVLEATREGGVA